MKGRRDAGACVCVGGAVGLGVEPGLQVPGGEAARSNAWVLLNVSSGSLKGGPGARSPRRKGWVPGPLGSPCARLASRGRGGGGKLHSIGIQFEDSGHTFRHHTEAWTPPPELGLRGHLGVAPQESATSRSPDPVGGSGARPGGRGRGLGEPPLEGELAHGPPGGLGSVPTLRAPSRGLRSELRNELPETQAGRGNTPLASRTQLRTSRATPQSCPHLRPSTTPHHSKTQNRALKPQPGLSTPGDPAPSSLWQHGY